MTALPSSHESQAGANLGPSWPMVLALWLAVVVGIIEVLVRAAERYLLHDIIKVGPHVVWMAPVVNLFWFSLPATCLLLAARTWPQRVSSRVIFAALTSVAFFSLILLYKKMHAAAAIVLAIGLAVQSTRLVAQRLDAVQRLVRRSLPWLVASVAAAAVVIFAWRRLAERRTLAALPAAHANAPNVLLLVLDTVRKMSLSAYGYARPTSPALERWAVKGVRFDRAFVTAPWTLPSHASMFTGRHVHELSTELRTPLDDTYPTLAEVLASNGYATAGFVANSAYCSYEHGLNRGFIHYEDYPITLGMLFVSSVFGRRLLGASYLRELLHYHDRTDRKRAEEVNQQFFRWLPRRGDRPFFAFLNYFDAHDPYLPPQPFESMFAKFERGRPITIETSKFEDLTPAQIQREQDAYDGAIAYMDREVDRLLTELERRGLFENTFIIITSDHGEHWGDHRLLLHANSLYRQLLEVPLIMLLPSRLQVGGRVVRTMVSLRDLPVTVFDVTGVEPESRFPGASLAGYWRDDSPGVQRLIVAGAASLKGNRGYSLISSRWHYIKRMTGEEELYAVDADPLDSLDLAATPLGREELIGLRAMLDSVAGSHVAMATTGPQKAR